jgi:hypothetical protein
LYLYKWIIWQTALKFCTDGVIGGDLTRAKYARAAPQFGGFHHMTHLPLFRN